MPSYLTLDLRMRRATADLDAIEAAEAEFRNLVTAWALRHPTYAGEKAMPHIESFLTDYFDHERREAREELEGGA